MAHTKRITPSEFSRKWSDAQILALIVEHKGIMTRAEASVGLARLALREIVVKRGLLKTLRRTAALMPVPGVTRTFTKKEIRDAYRKANGCVREVRQILHLRSEMLQRELRRLGIEAEIAKRWKKRQHGGERDAGEVRQIDVARATGRTRAAVSAAIAKGRTVQDLLRTPKGERVATPHDSIYREIEVEYDALAARGGEVHDDWEKALAVRDDRRRWLMKAALAVRAIEAFDRKAAHG